MTLHILVACTMLGAVAESDSDDLLRRIEAARPAVEDVYLEYEGQMSFPTLKDSENTDGQGVYDSYSGVYVARRDGAAIVEITHRYPENEADVRRETLSILGDRFQGYTKSDSTQGSGRIERASVEKLRVMGSIARGFLREQLVEMVSSRGYDVAVKGAEDVEGRSLTRVEVSFRNDVPITYTYWLDMDRDAHVVKYEGRNAGNLANRLEVVSLDRFEDGRDRAAWIPTRMVYEAFEGITRETKGTYSSTATNRETFDVRRESVKLGAGFKDDRFTLKFKRGTWVSDDLKNVSYEVGRPAPPRKAPADDADLQAALEEHARLAEAQGDEALASSPERWGRTWSDWLRWGFGILGLVTLGVLGVRGLASR